MIFDLNMQPVNEFISGLEAGHHISFVPEIRTADRVNLPMPELRRMALCLNNVIRATINPQSLCYLTKDNASPERAIAAVYALMDMARAALRLYDLTDKQMLLTIVARWFDDNDDLKEYAIATWFTEVKPA